MANRPLERVRVIAFLHACFLVTIIVLVFFFSSSSITVSQWSRHAPSAGFSYNNTDWLNHVRPASCHAHNDYTHEYPLYSALQAGCIGVEADVWLYQQELYVGHSRSALRPGRTLMRMYLEPLLEILQTRNKRRRDNGAQETPVGVFARQPSQTLTLLVDLKMEDGKSGWPLLISQLEPLRRRGYLTHYNGASIDSRPITIVATGNAPFDMIISNSTYRDVFLDAPLDQIKIGQRGQVHQPDREETAVLPVENQNRTADEDSGNYLMETGAYNHTNSYYASASFRKSIGLPYLFVLSKKQTEIIKQQVRSAHDMNLKVRYWSVPGWPPSLKRRLMKILLREGVDLLNIDDFSLVKEVLHGEHKEQ